MKQALYHGSYMAIAEPRILQGRFTKDFGEGFYCTVMAKQAIRWANKYDTPVLSTYEYLTFINSENCAYED